ncbi:hypothetical protein GCM10009677_19170 [Sphaerisporangium rubeum]
MDVADRLGQQRVQDLGVEIQDLGQFGAAGAGRAVLMTVAMAVTVAVALLRSVTGLVWRRASVVVLGAVTVAAVLRVGVVLCHGSTVRELCGRSIPSCV